MSTQYFNSSLPILSDTIDIWISFRLVVLLLKWKLYKLKKSSVSNCMVVGGKSLELSSAEN